jgi:Flp pilus assembly protein TadD
MFTRMLLAFTLACSLAGQQPASLPPPGPPAVLEDPLEAPEELTHFARKVTLNSTGVPQKLKALLLAIFRSQEEGGLGITYDASRTRTVKEVWLDRKANCLSLTALFVHACKSIGIQANYAEPINAGHWTRSDGLIRYERHLVAIAPVPPLDDMVADFLPQIQHRRGHYIVNLLPENRVRALWASNRAVEAMIEHNLPVAEAYVKESLAADPSCSVGWNTLGVINTQRHRVADAEECYRKALSLDPKDASVIGNMELLLKGDGRWEEAVKYRQLSLDLRKRDPYFQAFLAEEAVNENRMEEALKLIRSAIKLQPYDSDFYVIEAGIRLSLGRMEDAEKSLELARKWALPAQRNRFDNKLAALKQLKG